MGATSAGLEGGRGGPSRRGSEPPRAPRPRPGPAAQARRRARQEGAGGRAGEPAGEEGARPAPPAHLEVVAAEVHAAHERQHPGGLHGAALTAGRRGCGERRGLGQTDPALHPAPAERRSPGRAPLARRPGASRAAPPPPRPQFPRLLEDGGRLEDPGAAGLRSRGDAGTAARGLPARGPWRRGGDEAWPGLRSPSAGKPRPAPAAPPGNASQGGRQEHTGAAGAARHTAGARSVRVIVTALAVHIPYITPSAGSGPGELTPSEPRAEHDPSRAQGPARSSGGGGLPSHCSAAKR